MVGLTTEQACLHLFKNNRDPSDVQTYATFTTSQFPTALTYTMGAMSYTKTWSNGFKHPDVSRHRKVRQGADGINWIQITAAFLVQLSRTFS